MPTHLPSTCAQANPFLARTRPTAEPVTTRQTRAAVWRPPSGSARYRRLSSGTALRKSYNRVVLDEPAPRRTPLHRAPGQRLSVAYADQRFADAGLPSILAADGQPAIRRSNSAPA